MSSFVAQATAFVQQNFSVLLVIAAVIVALWVAGSSRGDRYARDPRRAFTPNQRLAASRRAGGRCEHSALGFRCRQNGSHADHVVPWSRGGATELSNCQWLCQGHNLRKSNTVPSFVYLGRLERRRRRYFPAGEATQIVWQVGSAR